MPSPQRARSGSACSAVACPTRVTLRNQVDPFRQGLRELGWSEGQNLAPIEFRWAEGKHERFPALLDELLRLDLDLLVTISPRPAMLAKEATKTLPIVALAVDDPVTMGLVASIARPGGNITGISAAFAGLLREAPATAEGNRARGAPVRGRVQPDHRAAKGARRCRARDGKPAWASR